MSYWLSLGVLNSRMAFVCVCVVVSIYCSDIALYGFVRLCLLKESPFSFHVVCVKWFESALSSSESIMKRINSVRRSFNKKIEKTPEPKPSGSRSLSHTHTHTHTHTH